MKKKKKKNGVEKLLLREVDRRMAARKWEGKRRRKGYAQPSQGRDGQGKINSTTKTTEESSGTSSSSSSSRYKEE